MSLDICMHFKIVPLTHLFWVVVGKMHAAAMLNGSCLLDGVPLWRQPKRAFSSRSGGGRTRMWAQLGMWKWKNEILPSSQGISSYMNESRPHSLSYDKIIRIVKTSIKIGKIMDAFSKRNSWILRYEFLHGFLVGNWLNLTARACIGEHTWTTRIL